MSEDHIDVVLTVVSADLEGVEADLADQQVASSAVADELDEATDRLQRLMAEVGVGMDRSDRTPVIERQSTEPRGSEPAWTEIVDRARRRLDDLGIDPSTVSLDDLLSPADRRRIERRHSGSFEVRAQLDRYDVLVAVAAGAAATAVDALIVRVPVDVRWKDVWQKGSPLTKAAREISIGSDNWLARLFRVPFDQITDTGIDGIGPRTHRVQTFGHDPLIGLVMGTIDIMRGTITGVSKTGQVVVTETDFVPMHNPLAALTLEILHLLSDVPTRMGLPLPGWSILMTMPVGSIGPDNQTINELARQMYWRGYNTTHLLTMATVPATVELILAGYWELRRQLDTQFAADLHATTASERDDDPRYQALLLLGHGVATAGNIAKVAGFAGNPLAINYAEWMRFTQRLFGWAQGRLASPGDVLVRQMARNQAALDEGWDVLGVADQTFTELAEATWPRAEET